MRVYRPGQDVYLPKTRHSEISPTNPDGVHFSRFGQDVHPIRDKSAKGEVPDVALTANELIEKEGNMNIVEYVEAPAKIKELAAILADECPNVVLVTFEGSREGHPKDLGAWVPELGWIRIFLGSCLANASDMMSFGFSFLASVWINAMMAVIHEFRHARQFFEEPSLLGCSQEIKEVYEKEAWATGIEEIAKLSGTYGVPRIEQMGWMGKEISEMLNSIFASRPQVVMEILEMNGEQIAGRADIMFHVFSGDLGDSERWLKQVDEEVIGMRKNGKCYLTYEEGTKLLETVLPQEVTL